MLRAISVFSFIINIISNMNKIMEDEFNYQAVPYGYTHCFNACCPKGEKNEF